MNLHKAYAAILFSILSLNSNAFAIDQVILKSGAIIEGKILSEVPNRHVDIQLVNGTKKRIQQTQVSSVERDVPSDVDQKMTGNESGFYFGPQLGLRITMDSASSGSTTTFFTWGARAGFNTAQLGDFAKFAVGLSFLHAEENISTVTASENQVFAQFLFRKVGNTGFYFGPELGLDLLRISTTASTTTASGTAFGFGVDLGYDYYLNDGFSIGTDFRFNHINSATITSSTGGSISTDSSNFLKIMLTGTFHL